jgi:hypothetical protein
VGLEGAWGIVPTTSSCRGPKCLPEGLRVASLCPSVWNLLIIVAGPANATHLISLKLHFILISGHHLLPTNNAMGT